MSALPQISESEFEIMKIVWQYAPVSTNDITDQLMKTTAWSAKTIQTLIRRLVTKGALSYEKQGRVFVYTPLIREDEYLSQKSSSFLNRYYDGHLASMVSSFMEHDRLSDEEIDSLRALLSGKKDAPLKEVSKKGTAGHNDKGE